MLLVQGWHGSLESVFGIAVVEVLSGDEDNPAPVLERPVGISHLFPLIRMICFRFGRYSIHRTRLFVEVCTVRSHDSLGRADPRSGRPLLTRPRRHEFRHRCKRNNSRAAEAGLSAGPVATYDRPVGMGWLME